MNLSKKTEIELQMQKINLWLLGGVRVEER